MESLIKTFYTAFNALDAEAMISCYHDEIIFEDPVFGILKGQRAKAMWQMLCESQKGKDFEVIASKIKCTSNEGEANWEAFYTFSKTQRRVHNKIKAEFVFKDGLIVEHKDVFSLHNWAKQALGFKGLVLGRAPYFRNKLRSQTNAALNRYLDKKSEPHK